MFKNNNNKKLNRRAAFRIYEQANLFYQKIDSNQVSETQPGFESLLLGSHQAKELGQLNSVAESSGGDVSLPSSISQENDTLNVNISSTGIAFTCKDKLEIGDYLMIRILLLSNMTLIMACCKVVYSKPSNPYEKNQYPFLTGVQFINLTSEDTKLLVDHVSRRKKQQLFLTGLMISIFMTILAIPEEIFNLVLDLSDKLLDVIVETVYIIFDYMDVGLGHVIKYLFNVSPHGRQMIGFYVLLAIQLVSLIVFLRVIVSACMRLGQNLVAYVSRKKASVLYYWGRQTLLNKIKMTGIGVLAISCYVLFAV